LYFLYVAKQTTELVPLPSEQYWCSIVILLPEAQADLIEFSDHHKTARPHSNEQSSAIRPQGQRPHVERKINFRCTASVFLFSFPSSHFPFCAFHVLHHLLFHRHHLSIILHNFINLRIESLLLLSLTTPLS
jgi:hypothetical protein